MHINGIRHPQGIATSAITVTKEIVELHWLNNLNYANLSIILISYVQLKADVLIVILVVHWAHLKTCSQA
jgi:hypothetical protein